MGRYEGMPIFSEAFKGRKPDAKGGKQGKKGKKIEAGKSKQCPMKQGSDPGESSTRNVEEAETEEEEKVTTINPWRQAKNPKGRSKQGKETPLHETKGKKGRKGHKNGERQEGALKGARQDDFMNPPPNLRDKTDTWRGYSRQERDRTLHYLEHDPDELQESLRKWLRALFSEGPCAMKRVNFLLFCLRGIKIQEFVKLNEGSRTLLQAVHMCCGLYPNPKIQREEEDKILLKRMQQQQQQQQQQPPQSSFTCPEASAEQTPQDNTKGDQHSAKGWTGQAQTQQATDGGYQESWYAQATWGRQEYESWTPGNWHKAPKTNEGWQPPSPPDTTKSVTRPQG